MRFFISLFEEAVKAQNLNWVRSVLVDGNQAKAGELRRRQKALLKVLMSRKIMGTLNSPSRFVHENDDRHGI